VEEIQSRLRAVVKTILFITYVICFLLTGYAIHFSTRDQNSRRRRFMANTKFFANLANKSFDIKVEAKNKPAEDEKCLLVGNHMGFLDLLAVYSSTPSLFVTSEEMHEAPVLGLITEMAGCIYVERRNRAKTVSEMRGLAEALRQGFRIVLYPEATSTNGEQVLPFKRTLMMAASEADVPIQPFVVNFKEINGDPFIMKWRDHVCWYGDMTFAPSMWKSFTLKSLTIEVEYLEKVYPKKDEDRAVLADRVRDMIVAKFIPVDKTAIEAVAVLEADLI
jgi:1-acyl-sn-glycerol-3-phosphate acyltransferase